MAGESVQVCLGSSWPILEGSLESCISVVFLDPHDQEPIISSSPRASGKLVLVPPSNPVPCELTVKFHGRLCHIQSFYSLSTSRICELYSCARPEEDPEYICTVKAWQPQETNAFDDEGGDEKPTKDVDGSIEKVSTSSSPTNEVNFAGSTASCMGLDPSSTKLEDIDLEKSVYSADDSWVDVKLNGLLSRGSTCESLTAPELDNWHMPLNEDELVHLEGKLVQISSRTGSNDSGAAKTVSARDGGCCDVEQHRQDLYEAELELVDHSPWAAITVRFLSLQDKKQVEIEQIVLLAIAGPVPELSGAHHSTGNGGNSALLAMFIPSMLQMARRSSDSQELMAEPEGSHVDRSELLVEQHDAIPAMEVAHSRDAVTEQEQHTRELHLVPPCVGAETKITSILEESKRVGFQDINMESGSVRLEKSVDAKLSSNLVPCRHDACHRFNELRVNDLFHTLEAFSERFDKLESLCARIEGYIKGEMERIDQRVTHLEEQHRKALGSTDASREEMPQAAAALLPDEPPTPSSIEQPLVSSSSTGWESKAPVSIAFSGHGKTDMLEDLSKEALGPVHHSFSVSRHSKEDLPQEALGPVHPFALSGHTKEDTFEDLPKDALGPVPGVSTHHTMTENPPVNIRQESLREPASMQVSIDDHAQKAHPSIDDAWDFALSAFASSLTPTTTGTKELPASQECEMPKDGSSSPLKTSHSGADRGSNYLEDVANSDCGLSREANEDVEDMYTFLHGIWKQTQSMGEDPSTSLPSSGGDMGENPCTSLPSSGVDTSNDEHIHVSSEEKRSDSIPPPSNAVMSTSRAGNLVSLTSQNDDGSSMCIRSDSILFDFGSAKQWANETDISFTSFRGSLVEEVRIRSSFSDRESQGFVHDFPNDIGIGSGAWFTSDSSILSPFASLQSKGGEDETLHNMDEEDLEDLFCGPQPAEGPAGGITTNESAPSPDLFGEGFSSYTHSEMGRDYTLYSLQDVNNKCGSRTAEQSIFYLNDPDLTDDDEVVATADKIETRGLSLLGGDDDCSDTDSVPDLSFWSSVTTNAGTKPSTTTIFPGFEDFS